MSLFKKQEKPNEVAPKDLIKKVQALEAKLEQSAKEIESLQQSMRSAISKIGITRFNPFKEIGGDQSFSIALLDGNNNGVVVTGYYGREMNRVYAKPIRAGKSEYQLSKEEQGAIERATGEEESQNSKLETQNPKQGSLKHEA